ncbi:myeloid leukemia factor 1 isoform X2 [Eublepharis macularius]|uniref:Myeloid leukemia factor 1 isoform X2 n=1 Tax=Eublepharis macularius TaxID=481883 RepID=A0AA97JIW4_EUBMA|nr:myeloid leukemia factor 1 isoform X2 [Eublepharis macularius]
MFGGLSRVFRDDPFFQDSFAAHREHMDRIFSEPFGPSPFFGGERIRNAIKDGGERTRDQGGCPDSRVALKDSHKTMSCSLLPFGSFGGMNMDFRDPFSTMDRMMSNMRNTMMELQQNFDKMSIDPNSHSFVSSSVMTYSKTGDEPPKVFQASAQTRRAPGGIKETRKSVKDSESGLEKMAVGHHIQDRAHVIQKAKNSKTGDEELNQEFLNLDEAEAHAFDEEWQKEITRYKPSAARNRIDTPRPRSIHRVSREDGARREKALPRTAIEGPRKPKSAVEALNVKGSHVPLKSSKK